MTKDEILEQLEQLFIITKIGEEYFITDKYKNMDGKTLVIEKKETELPLNYTSILNTDEDPNEWPYAVQNSGGRSRAIALMNACEIPIMSSTRSRYRLRDLNKEAIIILGKIVRDPDIVPLMFIEAIRRYYRTSAAPKAFKNLVIDGIALDLYQEFIDANKKGGNFIDPLDKPNTTWG